MMVNRIKLCPLCKKPVPEKDNPYRPFCSERCKLLDLGEWASDKYRIAGEMVDRESEEDQEKEEKK